MRVYEAINDFLAYLLVELNRSQATCNGYKKECLYTYGPQAFARSGGPLTCSVAVGKGAISKR